MQLNVYHKNNLFRKEKILIKANGPLKIWIAADILLHITWWNKTNKQKEQRKRGYSLK